MRVLRIGASGFTDTTNKQVIRNSIDLPVILDLCGKRSEEKLDYFGLPGARALDVIAWKNHIRRITAIERGEKEAREMKSTLTRYGLERDLLVFETNLEDFILNENKDNPKIMKEYGIINLDFEGPILIASSSSNDRRLRSIEKIIGIQEYHKNPQFVLFLTIQAARSSHTDFRILCEQAEGIVAERKSNIGDFFEFSKTQNRQEIYLALAVPLWISSFALLACYLPECLNMVFYSGTSGVPMVHFVFKMNFDNERRAPPLVVPDLFEKLPLWSAQQVENGIISTYDLGFPNIST